MKKPMKYSPLAFCILGAFFTITAYPSLAAEVGSQSGGDIVLGAGDSVIADKKDGSGRLYGINVSRTGAIKIGEMSDIKAQDNTLSSVGVSVESRDSSLTANAISIDVVGKQTSGIESFGSHAEIDLGEGSRINAIGDTNAYGIMLYSNSSVNANQLSISTQAKREGIGLFLSSSKANLGEKSHIQTTGDLSYGVYLISKNARLAASALSIGTVGRSAYGINIQDETEVDLGTGSSIRTQGEYAHGIWTFGKLTAEGINIQTDGAHANGIEVRDVSTANIGAGSVVISAQGGGLVTHGKDATLNFSGSASARNQVISGGTYGVSAQSEGASITLNNTDVSIKSDNKGRGLWALGGGIITGNDLSISGDAGTTGILAQTGGQVDITGNIAVAMASAEETAMQSTSKAGEALSQIKVRGKMSMVGRMQVDGGTIDLDMTDGSLWEGSAGLRPVVEPEDQISGAIHIAMKDSTWRLSADSNVNKLALNNAVVDFTSNKSAAFSTLQVGELSGQGHFILRTDIVGDGKNNAGDRLVVNSKSEGHHLLTFVNQGDMATTGSEHLTVVETVDGNAVFEATSQVELGGYLYDLHKSGNNWEIYAAGTVQGDDKVQPTEDDKPIDDRPIDDKPLDDKPIDDRPIDDQPTGDIVQKTDHHDKSTVISPLLTSSSIAGANGIKAGYLLNQAENQLIMQKIRSYTGDENGRMWLGTLAGGAHVNKDGRLNAFNIHHEGFFLGAEKAVDTSWYWGAFAGVTRSVQDYKQGKGNISSHALGLYVSHQDAQGLSIDALLKASWLDNRFSVKDSQGNQVSANGRNHAISAGLYAEQRFYFPELTQGFYVAPQSEFILGHFGGKTVVASNGLKIRSDSYQSLNAEFSGVIGYEGSTQHPIDFYIKTGILREFNGKANYRLNGAAETLSMQGTKWHNQIGATIKPSQRHSVSLEAGSLTGHSYRDYQAMLGYQFNF